MPWEDHRNFSQDHDHGDETPKKKHLCPLILPDRVVASSRMAAGTVLNLPIWVLEVTTQRRDPIGVIIFRGDKVSILTDEELRRA